MHQIYAWDLPKHVNGCLDVLRDRKYSGNILKLQVYIIFIASKQKTHLRNGLKDVQARLRKGETG